MRALSAVVTIAVVGTICFGCGEPKKSGASGNPSEAVGNGTPVGTSADPGDGSGSNDPGAHDPGTHDTDENGADPQDGADGTLASATGTDPSGGPPTPPSGTAKFVGQKTCGGAASCHVSAKPTGKLIDNNEHTRAQDDEPHRFAFNVLKNDRSRQIAKNLGIADAQKDPRCLTCHALPATAEEYGDRRFARLLRQGVSCEGCHGAGDHYKTPHRIFKTWRPLSKDEKAEFGLLPTKGAVDRALSCVGCHIGAPPSETIGIRDANHVIMAAGHPRLTYELWDYQQRMPKHWKPKDAEARDDFDALLWIAGQVVTTKSALELLVHRIESGGEWPEFAEYDCYSCHHDLMEPSWRQGAGTPGVAPGSLPWGTWYELTPLITTDVPEIAQGLSDLRKEMGRPIPNREKSLNLARSTAQKLDGWLASFSEGPVEPTQLRTWLTGMAQRAPKVASQSWDHARQIILAMSALHAGLPGPAQDASVQADLEALRAMTQLEVSPFRRAEAQELEGLYDSPRTFDPKKLQDALGRLKQHDWSK